MKNRSLDPTEFVHAALWHRTIETLYETLHEADTRGLAQTIAGVRACYATLILINRRAPRRFPIPIVTILPMKD